MGKGTEVPWKDKNRAEVGGGVRHTVSDLAVISRGSLSQPVSQRGSIDAGVEVLLLF